jgi:hypothetical protein
MKNYTVGPGDTISRIIIREYAIDNVLQPGIFDCLIRYVAVINNKDLSLYDNINTNILADPDSLKPGVVLVIPDNVKEAFADPRFKEINGGACGALLENNIEPDPAIDKPKMKLWPVYAGIGLLAFLLLTRKKKRKK